jgi:hypothetical protein
MQFQSRLPRPGSLKKRRFMLCGLSVLAGDFR